MLAEQLTGALWESRESFTVYRLSKGESGKLDNRNAANIEGLVAFLERVAEADIGHGRVITAYRVEAETPFDRYVEFNARTPRREHGQRVGVRRYGPAGWQNATYSFPAGGEWKARPVGRVDLKTLDREAVEVSDGKYKRFVQLGWVQQRDLLRQHLPT